MVGDWLLLSEHAEKGSSDAGDAEASELTRACARLEPVQDQLEPVHVA